MFIHKENLREEMKLVDLGIKAMKREIEKAQILDNN